MGSNLKKSQALWVSNFPNPWKFSFLLSRLVRNTLFLIENKLLKILPKSILCVYLIKKKKIHLPLVKNCANLKSIVNTKNRY